jgi:hypothetical protein
MEVAQHGGTAAIRGTGKTGKTEKIATSAIATGKITFERIDPRDIGGSRRIVIGGNRRIVIGGNRRVVIGCNRRIAIGANRKIAIWARVRHTA